jgi:hypothetical protein
MSEVSNKNMKEETYKYILDDLDWIFVRIGSENKSLNEMSDKEFVGWAKEFFKIEIIEDDNVVGDIWVPEEKIEFLNDMVVREGINRLVMIRREMRNKMKGIN